jgi:hypothetical protein
MIMDNDEIVVVEVLARFSPSSCPLLAKIFSIVTHAVVIL